MPRPDPARSVQATAAGAFLLFNVHIMFRAMEARHGA